MEPVSIAVHAVSRAPIRINDTALIVGAGTIGLLLIKPCASLAAAESLSWTLMRGSSP